MHNLGFYSSPVENIQSKFIDFCNDLQCLLSLVESRLQMNNE